MYADYSHGVRLFSKLAFINGDSIQVENVLTDSNLWRLLSNEGVISKPYYPATNLNKQIQEPKLFKHIYKMILCKNIHVFKVSLFMRVMYTYRTKINSIHAEQIFILFLLNFNVVMCYVFAQMVYVNDKK